MGRRLAFAVAVADAVAAFDARLQPSLWDTAVAAAVVMVAPKPVKMQPLRTVPLPASGKPPERDARLVVAGEGESGGTGDNLFAWAGEMQCGRERHYALLVRYDDRDDKMAPRRCVSVERVLVVASESE